MAWAIARLLFMDEPLRDAIAEAALPRITAFAPQNIVNIAWAVARLLVGHSPLEHAISSSAIRQLRYYDAQMLSNTAWALAARVLEDTPLINAIAASAIHTIASTGPGMTCTPQDLSNPAWAFARLLCIHMPLLDAISAAASRKISEFTHQNIANTAWAFAILGLANVPLMAAIASEALRTLSEWKAQSLANTAWSFASLELAHPPLLHAISSSSITTISQFSPQELTNPSWSFSALQFLNAPLFYAISAAAMPQIHHENFKPHDLSGIAWSLSSLECQDMPLMDAIAAAARAQIHEFRPQDLANTAWSFANIGLSHEPLLAAISASASPRIIAFGPQDLGNTVWAYAKLEVPPDKTLLAAISASALTRISDLEPPNLAMTAWAFATLGITHEPLLTAIAFASVRHIAEFALHHLSNLLWSYPCLELQVERSLFPLAREVLLVLIPAEVSLILSGLRELVVVSLERVAEVGEVTNCLLECAWAFAFAGEEIGSLLSVIKDSLMKIAKALDEKCTHQSLSGLTPCGNGPTWNVEVPTVILDLPDMVAILKPPLWEVDARAGSTPSANQGCGAPQLSSFLRRKYSPQTFPLVHCCEQQFGIIHRLDTPSSGLILAGKNFLGYYTLRWQLDMYELGREYLVLCHGRMPFGSRVISAKIRTTKTEPACSRVSADGKPAWTMVVPLCIVSGHGAEYSLVTIVIRTGRTHQIRVHLQHIGHPTVTDGRYCDAAIYEADRTWCPRNFLHRFRLTFEDTETVMHKAVVPLPEDLRKVLRTLRPSDDGHSPDVYHKLCGGWVPDLAPLSI